MSDSHLMRPEELYITGYTSTYDDTVYNLLMPCIKGWRTILDDKKSDTDLEERLVQDYEEHEIPNPYTQELKDAMQAAQDYLGKTYVSLVSSEYEKGYKNIWSRTAEPATRWHNDLPEGCNLFFLCYLSDVFEGGEINFRVNGTETGIIQPRKGLIVMASQQKYVEHRVSHNPPTQTRTVSNFGFNLKYF